MDKKDAEQNIIKDYDQSKGVSDSSNPTIDNALKFIAATGEENISLFKTKGLGLQLVLLGLAEIQALRVSKLSTVVYHLEQQVFDVDNLRDKSPGDILRLYNQSVQALKDSAQYVSEVNKTVDWNDIESRLIEVKSKGTMQEEGKGSRDMEVIADQLLKVLTPKLQKGQLVNEDGGNDE